MPQMAPLMWLVLFFLFSMTYLTFLINNHFNSIPMKMTSETNNLTSTPSSHWKW